MQRNGLHQGLRVRGSDPMVDVHPVRLASNGKNFGAQFMENLGRNVVSRAMGAVHHDFQTPEGQLTGKGTFAKLNITSCSIIQTAGLAQAS